MRDICAHLTEDEKAESSRRGGFKGRWVAATLALPLSMVLVFGVAQAVCFSEVRWPIHQGPANSFEPLGDEFLHDAALVHAGEAEVEAGVSVGEALVIKAEEL